MGQMDRQCAQRIDGDIDRLRRKLFVDESEQLTVGRQVDLSAGGRVGVRPRRSWRGPSDDQHRPDVGIGNLDLPGAILGARARLVGAQIDARPALAVPGIGLDGGAHHR